MGKKVLIIYNPVKDSGNPDEADVLAQVNDVAKAIMGMGHTVTFAEFDLNMDFQEDIDCIFNLVEAVGGKSKYSYMACALYEIKGLLYTGNGPESIFLTTGKTIAKKILRSYSLPVPSDFNDIDKLYIVKPESEDASVMIDKNCVIEGRTVIEKMQGYDNGYFIEEYIDGREFSVSMIEKNGKCMVFPPGEIIFNNYDDKNLYKILDYKAKWDQKSFQYLNTIPIFCDENMEPFLMKKLKELSEKCWDVFSLRGYARVDFRVDCQNNPYIIDINANPCIERNAGFARTLLNAGMEYEEVISTILEGAF